MKGINNRIDFIIILIFVDRKIQKFEKHFRELIDNLCEVHFMGRDGGALRSTPGI